MKITQNYLKQILHYDPRTGIWRWVRPNSNRLKPGDVAGANSHGYIRIKIHGKQYAAHILAWVWMTGEFPKHRLDHKNNDPGCNRWKNIRPATHSQNIANARCRKNKKVQLKGVVQRSNGFVARLQHKGQYFYLGQHKTAKKAHAAYVAKAKELFGEFARAS